MASVARFRSVVLDCPDPHALAAFYAAVAGGAPEAEDDDWVVLKVPDGPRLAFQRAPGYAPPDWPRADRDSQQFHLDFDGGSTWEEMDVAHEKVLALGQKLHITGTPAIFFSDGSRIPGAVDQKTLEAKLAALKQ